MKGLKMLLKILLVMILLFIITVILANISFNNKVEREVEYLMTYKSDLRSKVLQKEVDDLPQSVQNWFDYTGLVGTEKVETVFLKQEGRLRLTPDQEKWQEASATQNFVTHEPGFVWSVKTNMKGLPVVGRDRFQNGKGNMLIKILGLIPVVDEKSHEKLDESTFQRYLGEISWFPSAALSPYITWQEIDAYSAKAIMDYEGTKGEVTYHFNENGSLNKVEALRYRDVTDEQPTLWQVEILEHKKMEGLNIPSKMEVTWLLDEGPFTWYKFEITDLKYNE